jgi:Rad3-related DNA helicase
MATWQTESQWKPKKKKGKPTLEESFGDSLVKRAAKRDGAQIADRSWVVYGNAKLSDRYEMYYVDLPKGSRSYTCSCQRHAGGQYRKVCSHILYIVQARRGNLPIDDLRDTWALDEAEDPRLPNPEDSGPEEFHFDPPDDIPAFVEGSGAGVDQAREELDEMFRNASETRALPEWIQYIRETQWDALEQITAMYQEGKKVVFLDAPTGTGKTLLGEMVRRVMSPGRSIYTCSTLTLQDQFVEDFPYADVVKGRSNYPTADQPINFPTLNASQCSMQPHIGTKMCPKCPPVSPERVMWHCATCHPTHRCPYEQAKERAKGSRLAVTNLAYLLTVANYQYGKGVIRKDEPFIIIDEADVLEEQLLSFITLTFTKHEIRELGLNPPDKKTVMESWIDWMRTEAAPKIGKALNNIYSNQGWEGDPKLKNKQATLIRKLDKVRHLGGWEEGEWLEDHHGLDGWVYMDYERDVITFKPIRVDEYAQDLLWSKGKRFLLMSATIISAQQMAEDLGLEDDEWGVVTIDSDFPVENRPLYVQPVANMVYKEKDEAWPQMAETIDRIVKYHAGERILVHTVSYPLARSIKSNLSSSQRKRVYTYNNSREREPALKRWLNSRDGIMLAPSFERGVDLADDLCRVIIIAKVPFPNLGDKQVNGRLYSKGGQGWYNMLTVRSIVQMTGRGMRSKDDYCETYILDRQFVKKVTSKGRRLLPRWWRDALVMSGVPKERGIV